MSPFVKNEYHQRVFRDKIRSIVITLYIWRETCPLRSRPTHHVTSAFSDDNIAAARRSPTYYMANSTLSVALSHYAYLHQFVNISRFHQGFLH